MNSLFPEIWLLVIVITLTLSASYSFYLDYKYYKNNNWDWTQINPDFDLEYNEFGAGPPIKGPGRLAIILFYLFIGVSYLTAYALIIWYQ